jgi:hypothetical protein
MLEFTVASGPTNVLLSGIAFSFSGKSIEIAFSTPPLKLIFIFVDEADVANAPAPVSRIAAKVPDSHTFELTLFNFTNALGQGSQTPVEIGHIGEKAIYLHYRVYASAPGSDKELHFTIFQDKEPKPKEAEAGKASEVAKEKPKADG